MTLVLHTYTDVRIKDQIETQEEMLKIASVYTVNTQKMIKPDDYWSFLLRNWGMEDLIIVEQDVVAKTHHIDNLVVCQQKVCAYPYRLAAGQYSIWDMEPNLEMPYLPTYYDGINPEFASKSFPEYVDGSSLGLIKLCVCMQKKIPLHTYNVEEYQWWYLDSFISWHLKRLKQKVHVHIPEVKHNRTVEITFKIGDQELVVSNE